jgi:hypothetical protein
MKYLGMPIDEKRLVVSQWDPIGEKGSWLERKHAID